MIVGGYSLHLYCDNKVCSTPMPAEFDAETGAQTFAQAKRKGWKVDRKEGIALCPACVKEGRTIREVTP